MSSDSTSSSSGQDPEPEPLDDQFASLEVAENANQSLVGEVANGLFDSDDENGHVHPEAEEVTAGDSAPDLAVDEVVPESSGRNNSEVEVERGPSPSSSGYAGERGSSSSTSASGIDEIDDDDDEIQELRNDESVDHQPPWVPGKRHVDEDDGSLSWRKRKKHFFVLSNSGKPIYSRYGDEHKLAGFSATLQAIISFVENGGDRVRLVRAGKHQVVFLVKGPIYLVCISCTEEPYESLKGQLELLYGQDPAYYILKEDTSPCIFGSIEKQRWSYACAKQLIERLIYAEGAENGLEFTIVRPFNWIGPRMDFIPGIDGPSEGVPRVLACFSNGLLRGEPLKLVDGGANPRENHC